MTYDSKVTDRPHDRLTDLANGMLKALDRSENIDVKGIVLLADSEMGGMAFHGYDDVTDALVDMFIHLAAGFESQGKTLTLMSEDGVTILGGPQP